MNPADVLILLAVAVCVWGAVRFLRRKGGCASCGCSGGSCCESGGSCCQGREKIQKEKGVRE